MKKLGRNLGLTGVIAISIGGDDRRWHFRAPVIGGHKDRAVIVAGLPRRWGVGPSSRAQQSRIGDGYARLWGNSTCSLNGAWGR